MLKKIKDLTKEELESICDKYEYCKTCPLKIKGSCYCMIVYLCTKEKIEKKLENEVEVEDENRK